MAIGQHQGVAVGESHEGSKVGLEAAGEQQHLVTAQPLGQVPLQLPVDWSAAGHQAGGSGPQTTGGQLRSGGSDYGRMAAETEVVIAGQIQ
jgi:hypothetical protein